MYIKLLLILISKYISANSVTDTHSYIYADSRSSSLPLPFRIESLPRTPVLFESVGYAVFYKNTWTIFTKVTPIDYSTVLNFTDMCDVKITQLCSSLEPSFQASCNMVTNEVGVVTRNLRKNNLRLQHIFASRRNKRAIETIGNFFHWAFGTMDSDDSRKVYNQLKQLDGSNKRAFDIIKKQITVASSNFDRISKPIKKLSGEVEQIAQSLNNVTIDFDNFSSVTNKMMAELKLKTEITEITALVISKLLEIENLQSTELSILNDLYQNKLHPFILDTDNITSVLERATTKRLFLDLSILHQAVQLSTYLQEGEIILKITVPLPEADLYSIHKMYPVRTELDLQWDLIIDIKTDYIAEADNRGLFVGMTNTELTQCSNIMFNATLMLKVCRLSRPIHTSGSSNCIVELLQHSATSQNNCKYVASPISRGEFTKMSTKNQWLFNIKEPLTLNVNCDGIHYAPELNGFGILHILDPCDINTKELRIPFEQVWESSFKLKHTRVNHSDLLDVLRKKYSSVKGGNTSKRPLLHLGSHSDMIASMSEGKRSLEELQKEADMAEDNNRIRSQHWEVQIHRYSIVSIGGILVAVIIVVIISKYYCRKDSRAYATPSVINITTPNAQKEVEVVHVESSFKDREMPSRRSSRGVTFARV